MAIKRAKWLEGITQSRRILRDLAEIVTSAIKDEDGVVEAENWSLVYPRPFEETDVVRGKLIKDTADVSGQRYIPTGTKVETIKFDAVVPVELVVKGIIANSIVVKSLNGAVTYAKTADYTYDPATNKIVRVEGGKIFSGAEVTVEYNFTFNKILSTVPVVVEKKLTTVAADREISTSTYIVNYAAKNIEFLVDPPAAEYFQLTFTEKSGTYSRTDRTDIKLELDPLSSSGRRFKLPAGYGEIVMESDIRAIGNGSGAAGTGEAPYNFDATNKKVVFTTAPVLSEGDELYFTFYQYKDDNLLSDVEQVQRALLAKDATDATGKTYKISGTLNTLNANFPHTVELFTENLAPVLELHLNSVDAGYELVSTADYVLNYDNPATNFVVAPAGADEFVMTFKSRGALDLQLGLGKVVDRVILKTTTTPESTDGIGAGDGYGATDTATSLDMYVELYKPARLVNPENGLERYADINGSQVTTQQNNHYIQVRMFDRWDDAIQDYVKPKYDVSGTLVDKGANVSNWSKYAWFQDWKEYLIDELDSDAGISDLAQGVIFQEVKTNGMTDQFPIQFWISTNNNRIALVLMGDPTLDQDNFLTSFAYIGRIQPFYDTKYRVKFEADGTTISRDANGDPIIEEVREYFENDVSGNFALSTGSSTIPADIGIPPKGQPVFSSIDIARNADNTLAPGSLWDMTGFGYAVTYLTEGGESRPTQIADARSLLYIPKKTVNPASTNDVAIQGLSLKVKFTLPQEATGYKIYRFHYNVDSNRDEGYLLNASKYENYKLVTTVNRLETAERSFEFIDDGSFLTMTDTTKVPNTIRRNSLATDVFYKKFTSAVSTARSFESVVRDKFTGAILDVKFSDKFGKDTGNGVNDLVMYAARSGLKYQKHYPAFITTEEFMRKEKSGQSRWTGKFHLSPIYIEHSYDKQRGWLDGVMAVDDSGIAHLDELIVDKDTTREEVYKFFRINAPYSMFNNSPNYAYGIALIKSSMKWEN